ncbi:MAG TPA: DNA polymerase III subunit gamma/tau [Candidatus Babeliales bacterium]|jgi:DNA polymerase-3 subunit gamma/tau|nr:DNA polymerase III subunit gamma/tau [Candidatus Babeliales bacterium]
MESVKLNLSRKWRSRNFQGIVGQDLTLKMLKNSLYSQQYFPVYLFAGPRGCGKTTTARVFASALNCQDLAQFQKKPRDVMIPCGICVSCMAMAENKHPDFIEIDAASHTGVDNVRTIIETATLLPLIGHKKIYLIDEAHMLSKAAFNAFLKILEEPPKTALFILATTDSEKIIDTVRSRCFTLLFNPIVSDCLVNLLTKVCKAEEISYNSDALSYIAMHAQGSARDALNILEQVRFAMGSVQKEGVLQVLGHIDDASIVLLIQKTYAGNVPAFLHFWQEHNLDTISAEFMWQRILFICRILVWLSHGVKPTNEPHIVAMLAETVPTIPLVFLQKIMEALYHAEQWFMRSSVPQGVLEMVLLQLCSGQSNNQKDSGDDTPLSGMAYQNSAEILSRDLQDDEQEETEDAKSNNESEPSWASVLVYIAQKDVHLHSILSQAMINYKKQEQTIMIQLPSHFSFFSDVLASKQCLWHDAVQKVFGSLIHITTLFDSASIEHDIEKVSIHTPIPVVHTKIARPIIQQTNHKGNFATREKSIDITDASKWPKVHLILEYFPGVVTLVDKEAQQ